MKAWHQRNLLDQSFPFDLFISENTQFPPHWHAEMEIVYLLEGSVHISLESENYILRPRDILLISGGIVHSFISQSQGCRMIIVQFGNVFFDTYAAVLSDRRIIQPQLSKNSNDVEQIRDYHHALEEQIKKMAEEYQMKAEGYSLALKARLLDLVVFIIRSIPMERFSKQERRSRLERLERLDKVFQYVDEHLDEGIRIADVARIANFSVFHFTRFFKATTGMTFGEYLNSFRVKRAEWYLTSTEDTVTEVAFKAGFNSLQTFDRVFKSHKGCSPTEYRKAIFEQ